MQLRSLWRARSPTLTNCFGRSEWAHVRRCINVGFRYACGDFTVIILVVTNRKFLTVILYRSYVYHATLFRGSTYVKIAREIEISEDVGHSADDVRAIRSLCSAHR